MAYSVSIVLDAYDNASKVFDKVESRLTTMQTRINSQFAVPQRAEFAEQIQRQFEARRPLEDELFNLTHSAKERELRDAEKYFGDLRVQWQGNQSILTLIQQNETAKRKKIEEDYAENSLSTFRKYRAEYLSIIRTFAVVGFSMRMLEGVTGAMVTARDKGAAEGYIAFVKSLPLIGNSIANAGENIAELIENSNGMLKESIALFRDEESIITNLNKLLSQQEDLQKKINRLKTPLSERPQYDLEQEKQAELKKLEDQEITAKRILKEHYNETFNPKIYDPDQVLGGTEATKILREAGLKDATASLKYIQKEKLQIIEWYNLMMGEPARLKQEAAATEVLNKAKQNQLEIEKEIEQVQNRIYELRFGKNAAELSQMTGKGATDVQLARIKGLREIEDATIQGQKVNEDYAKTIKKMDDVINKHGYNTWQGKILDAMEQGIAPNKLNEMLSRYNRIEQLRLSENLAPQDRGWNPTESRFMSGRGSSASDYAQQTAKNTAPIERLLSRIVAYLERPEPQRVGNDLNIQTLDEGWA